MCDRLFFHTGVTITCLRVSLKVLVSKEWFAINEMGLLKAVFNGSSRCRGFASF